MKQTESTAESEAARNANKVTLTNTENSLRLIKDSPGVVSVQTGSGSGDSVLQESKMKDTNTTQSQSQHQIFPQDPRSESLRASDKNGPKETKKNAKHDQTSSETDKQPTNKPLHAHTEGSSHRNSYIEFAQPERRLSVEQISSKQASHADNSFGKKTEKLRLAPTPGLEVQTQKLRLIKMLSRNPEMR